ncbi:MAG: FAD-dependent oxidoreductase [Chloroflexi bacterium]|nr:FAD-dependent oxidoreductase [Chloroflexota bacterium]
MAQKPKSVFNVRVVDVEYYKSQIECQAACPVQTDCRGYVLAVSNGDYQKGYIQARQPNPVASTCGQVCNAPCEKACRRGEFGDPVSIRALKRFLSEQYGVEASTGIDGRIVGKALLDTVAPENSHTWESFASFKEAGDRFTRRSARVAVVGAGPAGLSSAHDLALLGYQVTIFEAASVPGGMHNLGVPEYRLDRRMVRREIEDILSIGNIEVKHNSRLGKDFTIKGLKEAGYEAIVLAFGLWRSRGLNIPGIDTPGVLKALEEFIPQTNLGVPVKVGKRIAVVGGGNTAMDVIRTSQRLNAEGVMPRGEDIEKSRRRRQVRELPPILRRVVEQREGLRQDLHLGVPIIPGREVHDLVVEAWDEMLADEVEKEDALEEGIIFHNRVMPTRIVVQDGNVAGVEVKRVTRVYDDSNRFNPQLEPGSERVIPCDTVILAIGQMPDFSWLKPEDGVEVSKRGVLEVDPDTMATTVPGVYAAGDIGLGPRLIIDAVADGHRAARAIDEYLQQKKSVIVQKGYMETVPFDRFPSKYDNLPKQGMLQTPFERPPVIPVEERVGVTEIEKAYTPEMAKRQGERCFECHVQTVFNGDLCIMCNGCVDICPENCLTMVPVTDLEPSPDLDGVLKTKFGYSLSELRTSGIDAEALGGGVSVMLKDDTACTRCALCAKRCPTEAITMESFWFEEELQYEDAKVDHAAHLRQRLGLAVVGGAR